MGREHEGDRTLVGCTDCRWVIPARKTRDGSYDLLGMHGDSCPRCGNQDFEELDA